MTPVNQPQEKNIILRNTKNPSDEKIKMMIDQCSQSLCLLCGDTPESVCVFSPPDSKNYGAAPGKVKQFFYALCNTCLETEDWQTQTENIMKVLCRCPHVG